MKVVLSKNPLFVLRRLKRSNIQAIEIEQRPDNSCYVHIKKADEQKFCKIFGIKTKSKTKKHIFVVTAIMSFILVFCLLFAQNFVFKVVVYSNDEVVRQQVLSQLPRGVFKKSSIDRAQLSTILMQNSRVVLASVNFVGLTLVVNIKAAEEVNFDITSNIIADAEGTVETITVISGTPAVERGDYVRVGDVLIYAYAANGTSVPALGNVGILTHLQTVEPFFEQQQVFERTGMHKTQNVFTFDDKNITINTSASPYKYFDTEQSTCRIAIGGMLPMYQTTIVFWQLQPKDIYVDFEQNKQEILEKTLSNARKQAGEYKTFFSQNAEYRQVTDGVYEITSTVQFLHNIGRTV